MKASFWTVFGCEVELWNWPTWYYFYHKTNTYCSKSFFTFLVRIPEWLSQAPVSPLQVVFAPQVQSLLASLESEQNLSRIIKDILCEDPRSVYLRDRYANQFYTFQIHNYHVSCKFDDNSHSVRVFRVVSAGSVCECGQPEWQCSIHGSSTDS